MAPAAPDRAAAAHAVVSAVQRKSAVNSLTSPASVAAPGRKGRGSRPITASSARRTGAGPKAVTRNRTRALTSAWDRGARRRRRRGRRPRRSTGRRWRRRCRELGIEAAAGLDRGHGVGEAGLGDEPGAYAVAVEASADERRPAELGEGGGDQPGERDRRIATTSALPRAQLLAGSRGHRLSRRAPPPTVTAGRDPVARVASSTVTIRVVPALAASAGSSSRPAGVEVAEAQAVGGEVGEEGQRLTADDTLEVVGSRPRRYPTCSAEVSSTLPSPSRSAVIVTASAVIAPAPRRRARRIVAGDAQVAGDLVDRGQRLACRPRRGARGPPRGEGGPGEGRERAARSQDDREADQQLDERQARGRGRILDRPHHGRIRRVASVTTCRGGPASMVTVSAARWAVASRLAVRVTSPRIPPVVVERRSLRAATPAAFADRRARARQAPAGGPGSPPNGPRAGWCSPRAATAPAIAISTSATSASTRADPTCRLGPSRRGPADGDTAALVQDGGCDARHAGRRARRCRSRRCRAP